jgi:hypothetical protein
MCTNKYMLFTFFKKYQRACLILSVMDLVELEWTELSGLGRDTVLVGGSTIF